MNKISVENAQKLSPPELIELIISNVPHTSIRNCLSNLENVEPPEQPPVIPKVNIVGKSVEPVVNSLNKLRNDCKNNPILIISENTKLPGKEGLYTVYYIKKSDGSFVKSFKKTSEFSKKTCEELGNINENVCKSFYTWIETQVAKDPTKKSAVKRVVDDYLSENIDLFNKDCKEFKAAMELLNSGALKVSNNIEELVKEVGEKTGVLIFPKFIPASVSGGEELVRIFSPFNKDGRLQWAEKDVSLDYIREKVSKIKKPSPGSEKYQKYEQAFKDLDKDTKFYRNLVKTAKNNKTKLGIDVYPFLLS